MNRPVRSNPRRARQVWVVAAVVAAAVVTLALTAAGVDRIEVVATLMFAVVFCAALLGGRTAGFLIAAACTVIYLVIRSQDVDEVGPVAIGLLVVTRGGCYVAVAQVTQLVRARLPDVDLPTRLPTWSADDAPVPTALYAGPVGNLAAERAAPAPGYDAPDPWGDPDATAAAPPPWAEAGVGAGGWREPQHDHADIHTDFATAAAVAGWPAGGRDDDLGPGQDPWRPPAAEPQLAGRLPPSGPVGWDQPPESLDASWPAPMPGGADDGWGDALPAEPPLGAAAAGGGGWDQPTGVMPQVPGPPAPPLAAAGFAHPADPADPADLAGRERAPWEVDLDAPAAAGWTPGGYDRPPAPSMPTGWIDDATSPLGDETIPVGYTGELFIAREMARLPLEGRAGPNGAPPRVNGDPDHHLDRRPSNGHPHPAGGLPPTAPVPSVPAGPVGAPGPGAGFGTPGPPPAVGGPRGRGVGRGAGDGGGGGGGYVPMSDPSEGIDPETRLWNARFFRERLAMAREAAVREGAGFSVVMIQVPDRPFQSLPYRRQVALLRELGHQFVSARFVDHLVHLPDENQHWFAVVLGDSDRVGATAFERRLRSAISGYLRNRGLHIGEVQSLALTSPDDDEAMAMVWTSLLGPSGGHEGPAMAYGGQA
jgi:hypothetical protein